MFIEVNAISDLKEVPMLIDEFIIKLYCALPRVKTIMHAIFYTIMYTICVERTRYINHETYAS